MAGLRPFCSYSAHSSANRASRNATPVFATVPTMLLPSPPANPFQAISDDVWHDLTRHLPLPALHALLQTSRALRARLLALLPTLLRSMPVTPCAVRAAAAHAAHVGDPRLAAFVLALPGLEPLPPDAAHPLKCAYSSAVLQAPVAGVMFRAYLRAGGSAAGAVEGVEVCESEDVVLMAADLAAVAGHEVLESLVMALAFQGRGEVVEKLLGKFPALRTACGRKKGCKDCMRRHSLLHVAAEQGDVRLVCGISHILGGERDQLLGFSDCNGESALAIAVRKRKSRVAQELVRCGAEVRELIGCTSRGGGRLHAGDVWFKTSLPVVDVD